MSTTARRSVEHRERTMLRIAGETPHHVRDRLLADHDLRLRPETLQQAQHRGLCHRDASGGRRKIFARQMQEYRAAAPGDARRAVVVDLDNKIVEMVVTLEPIAAAIAIQPYRVIVVSARRVFAPGVIGPNGPNRQECPRLRVTVSAPPQLPWPKRASWSPAVAFALIDPDAAATECDRHGLPVGGQPASAGIAGGGAYPDRGQRPITQGCTISD
jgi:hypothetical protein